MRSIAVLVHEFLPLTVLLVVVSVRPNAIDGEQVPFAGTLAAFGGAVLANASAYGDAQREAVQLRNAVGSRAVVDQAKGILMHALGCSAADALERMRRVSQTQHVKVTDVAKQVVEGHGTVPEAWAGAATRVSWLPGSLPMGWERAEASSATRAIFMGLPPRGRCDSELRPRSQRPARSVNDDEVPGEKRGIGGADACPLHVARSASTPDGACVPAS